ncbi:MAG: sialidase family protein [Planctomycetota bacterium]
METKKIVLKRLVTTISLFAVVLVVLGINQGCSINRPQFDGKKCYLSEKPEALQITDEGYLQWNSPGQQLVIRLDDIPLLKEGDIAEVQFLYKVEGRVPDKANFRFGLFDSKTSGFVKDDGFGLKNDMFKGYRGYYSVIHPHIPEDTMSMGADGEVKLPGKVINRTNSESPILLDADVDAQINRGISGFNAPQGQFVPLFFKVKRTTENNIHLHVTMDNVTYVRIEERAAEQIKKVDTVSLYFPKQWSGAKVTLAPICAAKKVLKPKLKPATMKHVNVYKEPGRFGGWPAGYSANQWVWGNEIMVSFRKAWYKASPTTHTVDWSKPSKRWQARSLDGGETWTLEEPKRRSDKQGWPDPNTGGINYTHPDFAMRVGGKFSISYDRGRTWMGGYPFKGLGFGTTSRHDYMVQGPKECLYFLSAGQPGVNGSNHSDRSFMVRTIDGGQTFKFVAWLTDEKSIRTRSVMPSAVRVSPTKLVAATRRKLRNDHTRRNSNWIETSASYDNGASWQYLSKVSDTDRGEENGSPPAMVCLRDGRLAITYGFRSWPLGIRARISEDQGKTWSDEIVLRDDGNSWDLGYPRMVQRADGKLVSMYYHNTDEHPAPHIVATIWDPDTIVSK